MAQHKPKTSGDEIDRLLARADARARDAGIEIEPEKFSLEWYRQDWPARKREFIENEIKIRDAFDKNKLKPFILNDAQIELLEASLEASEDPDLEDFTLKCRRLGISTYYLADYLADAVIEDGHHVRLVAQAPKTVGGLMEAAKVMYGNLRDEIKPQSKYNSRYDLAFENGSRISISSVVAGHEEDGRGETITRLHLTEVPFWQGDAEKAAVALCDAAKGGKTSGESTAKGVGDWYHKKYLQGKKKGTIRSHFFEWWWNRNYQLVNARFEQFSHGWYLFKANQSLAWFDGLTDEERNALRVTDYTDEVRQKESLPLQSERDCAEAVLAHLKRKGYIHADAEWHCREVAAFLAWRRQEIEKKGAKKFRVEYPENEIDPFAQTGGSVFDQSYLRVARQPRAAEPGHSYLVILDPSNGIEGEDPARVVVLDRLTWEQVHSWGGYEKQDQQARRCCDLSDAYYGAEIVIESNMGEAAILEVENLGYGHRLYKYITVQAQRDVDDGRKTMRQAMEEARPGLPMTEKVKRTAISFFEKAWREGEFHACSENLVGEAQVFVQNGTKMEAKSGFHDDEIMACAIGIFVLKTDSIGTAGYKSSGRKLGSAQARGY
jgi:hypothetical protein